MNLPTEVFDSVIVVHAPDEIGADQADEFLDFLTTREHSNIVLDMDATETLDSQGLTALLDLQDTLRGLGGDVKIATSNGTCRKVLEITRLDHQLDIFDSVIEAAKSFR
jgi:anti-anti-sigma factor